MSRLLAGTLEMPGAARATARWSALEGEDLRVIAAGPLRVAIEGPEPKCRPLTLFDGVLDNAEALAGHLACPSTEPATLISHGYRRLGRGIVPCLEGDFSLLIWDQEQRAGLLARDRNGAGGLYLRRQGSSLWFASEIRHLLAILPTRPSPDRTSVAHWVALSARAGPHTLYEGVSRLQAASMMELGGSEPQIAERYWQPRFIERGARTHPALAGELGEALEHAVCVRLPARGRAGVLMSGGLDSASVAAFAARNDRGLLACSGVFPDHPEVDESALIGALRSQLSIAGIEASVRPGGLLASILEHISAWECPPLGWSDFWTLPLLRGAARQGVTVTLGGDGGDELFGVRAHLLADRVRHLRALSALKLAGRLPGAPGLSASQRARVVASLGLAGALGPRAHTLLHHARARGEPPWLARAARRALRSEEDPYAWKRLDGPRFWAEPAYALTDGIEHAGILEHQRRRAAMAGLRARHPMLAPDLLELALCQAPEASFHPELTRPLLREATRGALPDSVRLRKGKAWFDSLIADCMSGPDACAIGAILCTPAAHVGEYLAPGAAENAMARLRGQSGVPRFRAMHLLWRLVGIECWLRSQEGTPVLAGELRASEAQIELAMRPCRASGAPAP